MNKLIKASLFLLTSEKGKKIAKNVIIITLSPLILCLIIVSTSATAATEHNHELINVLFYDTRISSSVPLDYKQYLENYINFFDKIDLCLKNQENVEGNFDNIMIKTILLSAYIDKEDNSSLNHLNVQSLVDCLIDIKIEHVDKEIMNEDGSTEPIIEEIIIKKVVDNVPQMIKRIGNYLNIDLSNKKEMIYELYEKITLGTSSGLDNYVPLFTLLSPHFQSSESQKYTQGKFSSPFHSNWKNCVSSEFGRRDPIKLSDGTITSTSHTGIDLAKSYGTDILAVADGKVIEVRYTNIGLGIFTIIDHGGGVFSIYGHTSRVIVTKGQSVVRGQKIAEVGSSGYSTGAHLHLEIVENRQSINPRKYLE